MSAADRDELAAWRRSAPTILRFLEELLAAQGDAADRELISLQHALAELLRSPPGAHQTKTIGAR